MIIIYTIPIWPILLMVLAVFYAGASWLKDVLPLLFCLILIKNVYIDLYCSIRKHSHNPFIALLMFSIGLIRTAVFFPILNTFLSSTGGLLGLIDLLLSLVLVIPIISLLWLSGELSALAYGIGAPKYSVGSAIFCNVLSIICILAIYFFFFH